MKTRSELLCQIHTGEIIITTKKKTTVKPQSELKVYTSKTRDKREFCWQMRI